MAVAVRARSELHRAVRFAGFNCIYYQVEEELSQFRPVILAGRKVGTVLLALGSDLRGHLPNRRQSSITSQLRLCSSRFSHIDENNDNPVALTGDHQRRRKHIE